MNAKGIHISAWCRVIALIGAWIFSSVAIATDETDVAAEADASVVSRSRVSTPWYDSEQGRVRPIEIRPKSDDSINRDSRWLPKPEVIRKPSSSSGNNANAPAAGGGNSGNGVMGSSITLGNIFGWIVLAAIVMGVVGIVVYAVSRAELKMANRAGASGDSVTDGALPDRQTLERIKHLPPELRRTDVNLRTECERLMKESQFEQAIILLLGHQLLLLDRNGLLRLSRGKTNGRYVRETRAHDDQCATWLRETADAFEQSYFGRHEISADVFDVLWQQNQRLESSATAFGGVK